MLKSNLYKMPVVKWEIAERRQPLSLAATKLRTSGNSHGMGSLTIDLDRRRNKMAKSKKIRVRLQAYDHKILDLSVAKIVAAAKTTGATVVGPIPLPTEKQVYTILRAVHKYKDSREQFEQRTHKRLIDIIAPTQKTVDALARLEMPAGVYIDIKMKNK